MPGLENIYHLVSLCLHSKLKPLMTIIQITKRPNLDIISSRLRLFLQIYLIIISSDGQFVLF